MKDNFNKENKMGLVLIIFKINKNFQDVLKKGS